jgi:hypothetical protein
MNTFIHWLSIAKPISERSENFDEDDILESKATEELQIVVEDYTRTVIKSSLGNNLIVDSLSVNEFGNNHVHSVQLEQSILPFDSKLVESDNFHLSPTNESYPTLDLDEISYFTRVIKDINYLYSTGMSSEEEYLYEINELREEFNLIKSSHDPYDFNYYFSDSLL